MKRIFKLLERIFFGLVILPPVYMAYRFVRWSLSQDDDQAKDE